MTSASAATTSIVTSLPSRRSPGTPGPWDPLGSLGSADLLSTRVTAPPVPLGILWHCLIPQDLLLSPGIPLACGYCPLASWAWGGSWGSAAPRIFRDHPEPPYLWGQLISRRIYSPPVESTASLSGDKGGIAATRPDSLAGDPLVPLDSLSDHRPLGSTCSPTSDPVLPQPRGPWLLLELWELLDPSPRLSFGIC